MNYSEGTIIILLVIIILILAFYIKKMSLSRKNICFYLNLNNPVLDNQSKINLFEDLDGISTEGVRSENK